MEPFVNVAVQLARQAGEYIRRQQDQTPFIEVQYKPGKGESTIIDLQAENIIIQGIRKKFPKHNILSEEQGLQDLGSDVTWIIDALDGTKNFLHQIGHYSVSIAIQVRNQIEHAVVLDPLRHECFTASRGRGAQLNNRRIRVSQNNLLNRCLIGAGKFSPIIAHPDHVLQLHHKTETLFPSIRRMGCASLDLAYVASGRLDGFYGYNLNTWDAAAGMLLIQESGGVVTDFKGESQSLPGKELLTGNLKLVKAWLDEIKKN